MVGVFVLGLCRRGGYGVFGLVVVFWGVGMWVLKLGGGWYRESWVFHVRMRSALGNRATELASTVNDVCYWFQ